MENNRVTKFEVTFLFIEKKPNLLKCTEAALWPVVLDRAQGRAGPAGAPTIWFISSLFLENQGCRGVAEPLKNWPRAQASLALFTSLDFTTLLEPAKSFVELFSPAKTQMYQVLVRLKVIQ